MTASLKVYQGCHLHIDPGEEDWCLFTEYSLLPTYSAGFILLTFQSYSTYYHCHFKDEKAETKKWNGLTGIKKLNNSTPVGHTVLCVLPAASHLILPQNLQCKHALMWMNPSKVPRPICDKSKTVCIAHVFPTARCCLSNSQGTPHFSFQGVVEYVDVDIVWNQWLSTEIKCMIEEKKFKSW